MNLTPKQTIKGTVAETQSLKGTMKDIPSVDNTLTKEGYAADAKAVGDALKTKAPISHTEDKGNPHGVTAEQVGARPDTWMPSASEIGARPDTWTPTAGEVGARPNTWIPTAEEVGARPNTWMPSAEQVGAATRDDVKKANPVNLLDNSDFRNPVNQRGLTVYKQDAGYSIDRWKMKWSGDGELKVNDGYITLYRSTHSAYVFQNIPLEKKLIGKTVTVAARVRGSGAVGFIFNNNRSSTNFTNDSWTIVTHTIVIPNYDYSNSELNGVEIATHKNCSVDCEWIALYEGEYTAETLPEYHPKGYGAELTECRRYYRPNEFLNCVQVSGQYFSVSKTIEMRVVPTVTILSFAPYGNANVTNFENCVLTIVETAPGVQRITFANMPTCTAHKAGGLAVNLSADL